MNVGVGHLDPGTLGSTDVSNKGINVTLDFNQMNSLAKSEGTSGLNIGAIVLGHEGFHVAMREAGVTLGDQARHYYTEEWRAYTTGAVVAHGLHVSLQSLPTMDHRDFMSRLDAAATHDCVGEAQAAEKEGLQIYGGCGPGE